VHIAFDQQDHQRVLRLHQCQLREQPAVQDRRGEVIVALSLHDTGRVWEVIAALQPLHVEADAGALLQQARYAARRLRAVDHDVHRADLCRSHASPSSLSYAACLWSSATTRTSLPRSIAW